MAQERISSFDLDFVDDFYFSALFDEEQEGGGGGEIFEVSDDRYAEELQFQEALMGSVIVSQMKNNGPSSMMVEGTPVLLRISDQPMQKEIIQSGAAESSLSFCEICVERKENEQMFKTESCVHSFCNDCISRHVAAKVQYGARIVICPGLNCRAVLDLDTCRPILTRVVIDLWEDALCEEVIDASQRFYCPFKDCSALLIDDNEDEAIRESECPFCHRLFCALCSVPWHSGIECEEFQRLNEDERGREDLMLRELAKDKKWSRCPQCKFYVERTAGCPHMVCSFAMDVEQDGLDQIMVDALGNKKQHQALESARSPTYTILVLSERFRTNRSTKAGDQASVMKISPFLTTVSCSKSSSQPPTSPSGDNSESEGPQGKDYLYWLGKEADSMDIAVGARAGVIDPLFSGDFLGKDSDIVFDYRQKVIRSFEYLQGDLLDFYGALRSRIYDRSISNWVDDIEGVENLGKRLLRRRKDEKLPVFTPPERKKVKGLAGLKSIAVRVVGGFSRRRKAKKKTKVEDKLVDMLHKMIFPVRRVWLAVSARLRARKNGAGLLELHNDVQTCGYEDVQVMWEILRRSESELMASLPKRKQRPFWRVFVWSNHSAASSFSANHS
ncbi:hypothetical protein NC652_009664 [Populus alba x Populus x berolinensis]|nr:hypothetical protein NC652_009664 [Populus alba x Populus x berolinensis]